MNFICPNCGESYYAVRYSTATAMYYPAIYKDGKNINNDANIETTYATCCNCHHDFSVREQFGQIIGTTDEGVTMGLTNPDTDIDITENLITSHTPEKTTLDTATINIETSIPTPPNYQWEPAIKDLQQKFKELKEEISQLKDIVQRL